MDKRYVIYFLGALSSTWLNSGMSYRTVFFARRGQHLVRSLGYRGHQHRNTSGGLMEKIVYQKAPKPPKQRKPRRYRVEFRGPVSRSWIFSNETRFYLLALFFVRENNSLGYEARIVDTMAEED